MIEGSCHCGAARWRFDGVPESATACNCTVCRRYGALWAYGFLDEKIQLAGPTRAYIRRKDAPLGFYFCERCGCVAFWRSLRPGADGRTWMAVNLRLAEPEDVAEIPLQHFDGLQAHKNLGQDGRVQDVWS